MHPKSVILLLIACTLLACNWSASDTDKPAITTDTLKYIYKNIERKSVDCRNKKDSGCIVAKIKYPVFIGQKLLNDVINHHLLTQFGIADKPENSLEQLADNYLKSGRDFRLNANAEVLRQDSSIMIMELSGYKFLGGARGYPLINFINWNTKAGKKIELNDILIDGYAKSLNSVAEKIFRKEEKLSDSAALRPNYLFPDGKFALNNNFLITPIGIRFLFNQYEIKPYPAAETNVLIPFTEILSLLRPGTVVTQYHK